VEASASWAGLGSRELAGGEGLFAVAQPDSNARLVAKSTHYSSSIPAYRVQLLRSESVLAAHVVKLNENNVVA